MGIHWLSVCQLAVILDGVNGAAELIAVLGSPVTYGSLTLPFENYQQHRRVYQAGTSPARGPRFRVINGALPAGELSR